MKRAQRGYPRLRRSLPFLASLLLILPGCVQETHPVGPTIIRPAPLPEHTLLGTSNVYRGGRLVGRVRTFRVGLEDGVRVTRVYNLKNDSLGYITAEGRAFRRRAFGGLDLVASSAELIRNVAAVMDLPAEGLDLQVVEQKP